MIRTALLVLTFVLLSACAIKPIEKVKIQNHILYIDNKGDLRSPDESYTVISNHLNNEKRQAEAEIERVAQTAQQAVKEGKAENKPSFYSALLMRHDDGRYGSLNCTQFIDAQLGKAPGNDPNINPNRPATPEEAYVISMIAEYCQSGKKATNITLFIHGGLNTHSASVNRAYDLTGQMLADHTYPIFIGWRAGAFSNLKAHLAYDRGGEYHPIMGPMTLPFIVVEDVFRSTGKAPRALWNTVTQQLTVPKSIKMRDEKAYESKRFDLVGSNIPRCNGTSPTPEKTPFHICKRSADIGVTAWDTIQLVNPLKYVTAPLVEGFGTGTWTSLLRRTDLLLQRDDVYRGIDNSETAFEKLLNALERLEPKPKINLIGHSMGSIVANNVIARHPDIGYENIIYMAAAARVKDVEFAIVPLLLSKPKVSFYNLSLDPYREILEPLAYGSLPNGSLLNWIDNYFSQISTFSDRTAGTWYNMMRAADSIFPPEVRSRVYLTAFGLPERNNSAYDPGPQKHGAFGDYRFWVPGFWVGHDVSRSFIRSENATQAEVEKSSSYLE